MSAFRREHLAVPAAVITAITLVVVSVSGLEAVGSRHEPDQGGLITLLNCIEDAVADKTAPGETVRVEAGGDPFVLQRVTEIVYPRLHLTIDPHATTLVVRPPSVDEGAPCGAVIEVVSGDSR